MTWPYSLSIFLCLVQQMSQETLIHLEQLLISSHFITRSLLLPTSVCGRLLTTLPLSCHSGDIHLLDKMSHNMRQFGQVTLNITWIRNGYLIVTFDGPIISCMHWLIRLVVLLSFPLCFQRHTHLDWELRVKPLLRLHNSQSSQL